MGAREKLEGLVLEMGGLPGVRRFLCEEFDRPSPGVRLSDEDAERVKIYLPRAWRVATEKNSLLDTCDYLMCITVLAGRASSWSLDMGRSQREEALQQLRDGVQQFRRMLLEPRFVLLLVKTTIASVNLLRRLGRFEEGLGLARRKLWHIEATADDGGRLNALHYMGVMVDWLCLRGGPHDTKGDSPALIKARLQEALVLSKTALAMAEDTPVIHTKVRRRFHSHSSEGHVF
jgi:hypothetical protein